MPILNYTTGIEAEKSIAEIQKCLAQHGASQILADYDADGNVTAISFRILIDEQLIAFRLPSDWRPVLEILKDQYYKPKGKRKVPFRLVTKAQALRVAWRIVKDWIEAQMAIVETKMVKVDQVFLPYAVARDGRTLYETVKSSNLLAAPLDAR